jgi:serine/threonine-protein kinase HipA
LLAPGSSLGGARPKASVRGAGGQLLIAKFPHKSDETNAVMWVRWS